VSDICLIFAALSDILTAMATPKAFLEELVNLRFSDFHMLSQNSVMLISHTHPHIYTHVERIMVRDEETGLVTVNVQLTITTDPHLIWDWHVDALEYNRQQREALERGLGIVEGVIGEIENAQR
jgi:predicted DNA-binding protein (UPF0278 family)